MENAEQLLLTTLPKVHDDLIKLNRVETTIASSQTDASNYGSTFTSPGSLSARRLIKDHILVPFECVENDPAFRCLPQPQGNVVVAIHPHEFFDGNVVRRAKTV